MTVLTADIKNDDGLQFLVDIETMTISAASSMIWCGFQLKIAEAKCKVDGTFGTRILSSADVTFSSSEFQILANF
jgi:hypothetical protein